MLYDLFLFSEPYKRLRETLEKIFLTVPAPYDWRKTIGLNPDPEINSGEEYLKFWIDKALAEAKERNPLITKVNIVAHSLGGLVVRHYLQSERYRCDVDKFIVLGTPNHGSADTYYPWNQADPYTEQGLATLRIVPIWCAAFKNHVQPLLQDLGLSLSNSCGTFVNDTLKTEAINFMHSFFPSVGEVLPIPGFSSSFQDENGGYLRSQDTQNILPYKDMKEFNKNPFLLNLNKRLSNTTFQDRGIHAALFLGSALETIKFIEVDNAQECSRDTPGFGRR